MTRYYSAIYYGPPPGYKDSIWRVSVLNQGWSRGGFGFIDGTGFKHHVISNYPQALIGE